MATPVLTMRREISPASIVVSIVGHFALAGGLMAADAWLGGDHSNASMVQEHTMVMLTPGVAPKQKSILPERPTRTPDPPKVAKAAPEAPPPPPKQSDLVLPSKDPPPEKGKEDPKPVDRSRDREALLRQTQKQALVKDPTAALGDKDQARTSPDGASEGTPGQGIDESDPEFAAWQDAVRKSLLESWVVVEADRRANPNAKVVVWLIISPDGTMKDPKVRKSSGVSSIDRAAVMAVYKAIRVKAPPSRLQEAVSKGLTITFDISETL